MTTQRDGMAGPGAADPAPDQAAPPEPITGRIVPPPRVESEPARPAGQREPAGDAGPADDLGPAENGEPAVDREPEDVPPLVTGAEPEDAPPLVTDGEPGDAPPLVTGGAPAPGPVPVADTPDTIPAAALAEQQWPAIQSLFVDDPRGAVERAAAAASEVTASLVATLEREQSELRAAWQQNADTEQLRTALQRYRAFCGRLEDLA